MKKPNSISMLTTAIAIILLANSTLWAQSTQTVWTSEQQICAHLDGLLKTWPINGKINGPDQSERLTTPNEPGWNETGQLPLGTIYDEFAQLYEQGDSAAIFFSSREQELQQYTQGMHLPWNERVNHFIDLYQGDKKESLRAIKGLALYYFPVFEKELKKTGLPLALKHLPAAQSGLNPLAVSKDGAAGMWQLQYISARRYGLRISEPVDERRHVRKSTSAALHQLKDLHQQYHDWQLAIAAYHSGPANVNIALREASDPTDFWSVYDHLPVESRDYVAAFMAVVYVMNCEEGKALEPTPVQLAAHSDVIDLERDVEMQPVADVLNLPIAQIQALNPTFRSQLIPAGETEYPFQLPGGYGLKFEANKDSIYFLLDSVIHKPASAPKPKPKVVAKEPQPISDIPPPVGSVPVMYVIQSGDALYNISKWFEVSVEAIQSWNGLKNFSIRAEDKLKIYVSPGRKAYFEKMNTLNFEEKQALTGR